jgi:hypothetical protein
VEDEEEIGSKQSLMKVLMRMTTWVEWPLFENGMNEKIKI